MWLGGKRAKKKPRKKRRNAKARYDKEHPVVPIRFHKSVKRQLAKEAKKKGLMLSEYIRNLVQGFEVRERVIEKVVEKPVVKRVTEMIDDPKKEKEIRELRKTVKKLRETVSLQQEEIADASRASSGQQRDIVSLRESRSSLLEECEKLRIEHKVRQQDLQQDLQRQQEKLEGLESSVSSISSLRDNLSRKCKRLEAENKELQTDLFRLENKCQWALNELKSNEEQNRKIAKRTAGTYGIQVRYVHATWEDMPE